MDPQHWFLVGGRFRYQCEGRGAGALQGATSTPDQKTFPKIQVGKMLAESIIIGTRSLDEYFFIYSFIKLNSVAVPDPGSGAFLTLDPGSGIGISESRIPDPKPIFLIA
jgi:hypothetical protein